MDELAERFGKEVHFVFVYAREPHPEEHPDFTAHESMEQKMSYARTLAGRHAVDNWLTVVDSLDGQVHRAYGGLPNMCWILDHRGIVVYRANRTVPEDVEVALRDVLRLKSARRSRPASIFYRESIQAAGGDLL
jgi:hypothetical protein